MNTTNNQGISLWMLGLMGYGLLAVLPVQAATINIVNPGFEDPAMANELNTSFDGVNGNPAGVPGWYSNQPSNGGSIHLDQWFPGRTGDNVMYLHGNSSQNFYTADFDLGVNLASFSTYTLTFDVLRWYNWDGVTSITQDNYVTFQAGVYTGADYDGRLALTEQEGNLYLLDGLTPVDKITVSLSFTTGAVAPDTKFWIGGDAYGNSADGHRATYDNFQMNINAIPEPSTAALLVLGGAAALLRRNRSCV